MAAGTHAVSRLDFRSHAPADPGRNESADSRSFHRALSGRALAAAPQDEVLRLWAGLGYYARARNLHRGAQQVVALHGGRLPHSLEALMTLPGIGRSTAGAILALSQGQRHPILDGNVKRVLARVFLVEEAPDTTNGARRLWEHAEACTPISRVAEYTQAIMDLGATVCTRANPACDRCPLRTFCGAFATDRVSKLPAPGAALRGGFGIHIWCSCCETDACCSSGARHAASGVGSGCHPNFLKPKRPRPGRHRDSRAWVRRRSDCRCCGTRSRISTSTSSLGCSRSAARRRKWRRGTRWHDLPHCMRSDYRHPWRDC